jgi:hypothetical protein
MLALTSSTFWTVGKLCLSTVWDQYIMLWAGCCISCMGDYMSDTLPGCTDTNIAKFKTYAMAHGCNDDDLETILYSFFEETSSVCSRSWSEL